MCLTVEERRNKKNEINRLYYEKKRHEISEKKKAYYRENKDNVLSRTNKYKQENKDKLKNMRKSYRENNKDKIKEYYKKNKHSISIVQKKYRLTEKGRLMRNNRCHKRRQLIKTIEDKTITKEFIKTLVLQQHNECKGCKNKLVVKGKVMYHVDHIHPLSKGGLHTASNIQLLCATCNILKHNKTIDDLFFK